MAMAVLWALAAYAASASYGASASDGASASYGASAAIGDVPWGSYGGSYSYDIGYGNLQCTAEAAAADCKYCSEYGELTDLGCKEMADDGECDYSCNSASCNWDGKDCFHDDK